MRTMNRVVALPSFFLALAMLLGTFGFTHQVQAEESAAPKVIALKFHADWCGSCKAMGPVFEDLTNKFDTQPVLFSELDLTNVSSRKQAGYLIGAMELEKIWNEYGKGKKTGFILLVDAKSKKVVAKLTREHDIKAMGAELMKAVESAS